jgi:hypothetical protein
MMVVRVEEIMEVVELMAWRDYRRKDEGCHGGVVEGSMT